MTTRPNSIKIQFKVKVKVAQNKAHDSTPLKPKKKTTSK